MYNINKRRLYLHKDVNYLNRGRASFQIIEVNNDKVDMDLLTNIFKIFIQNFDYSRFFLGHGTSRTRVRKIEEHGLLTRNALEKLNYSYLSLSRESRPDCVYFETCLTPEKFSIGKQACEIVHYKDTGKYINFSLDLDYENNCRYIVLKKSSIPKYKGYFVADEDSFWLTESLKHLYSDDLNQGRDCLRELNQIPRVLIAIYNLVFAFFGAKEVQYFIEGTPKAIFSIADAKTLAIQSSIDPEDISILKPGAYHIKKRQHYEKIINAGPIYNILDPIKYINLDYSDLFSRNLTKFKSEIRHNNKKILENLLLDIDYYSKKI